MPSYHDLHVTTPSIHRTSIFNLPFGLTVMCTRTGGWELVQLQKDCVIAGEYAKPSQWLVLDVSGTVICDSRPESRTEEVKP